MTTAVTSSAIPSDLADASLAAQGSANQEDAKCKHCAMPFQQVYKSSRNDAFCCNGCRGAYHLVHGLGLEQFYELRELTSELDLQDGPALDSLARFDDPNYLGDSLVETLEDGQVKLRLAISGLHCAACSWLIENALLKQDAVLSARVRMNKHTLEVQFDSRKTAASEWVGQVFRLGYVLSPLRAGGIEQSESESRLLLVQIAIAAFFAANAMWIAIALYSGAELSSRFAFFLRSAGMALGLASVLGPGRTFLNSAWHAIANRTSHMDIPIALGLSVGSCVGVINVIKGSGDVYFDSLTSLVFLLLVGRWVQMRQQHKAARALDLMLQVTPAKATLVRPDGSCREVGVAQLQADDRVRVLSGDTIPCDGMLSECLPFNRPSDENPQVKTTEDAYAELTHLDRSLLTGESFPVKVFAGDRVHAGVVNLGPPVDVCVTEVGAESRIGRIMQSVESASLERVPIVRLADRIGGYFVVAVTALAIVAFCLWLPAGMDFAVGNATALLIVACPCALALATPLAIAASLAEASRLGIFIRDGSTLERVSRPGRIWFDKTGTLTKGKLAVVGQNCESESLCLVASLEQLSKHPVAKAIVESAKSLQLELCCDNDVRLAPRQISSGVVGTVRGRNVLVGSQQFMKHHGVRFPTQNDRDDHSGGSDSRSVTTQVFIAIDGEFEGSIFLTDPIREDAEVVVRRLTNRGWKVGILSGDQQEVVEYVGKALGIAKQECRGRMSPEDKLAAIRSTTRDGNAVLMVGDGANDAAALAAADVGVAVRGGAEVSLEAAPVFVARQPLVSIERLVSGGIRTHRLILSTFVISLSYNCVAVALAFSGMISPLTAALLMPVSSLSVLAWTMACRTFHKDL